MAKRWNPVLGVVLSLLLAFAAAHFLKPPVSDTAPAFATLLLLTYPILFALFLNGPLWGGGFLISACLICLFFSLREGDGRLAAPLPVFASVYILSLIAHRRTLDQGRQLEVALERLEWEGNLMGAAEKKRLLQDPLLEEKLRRYLSLSQVAQFLNETLP